MTAEEKLKEGTMELELENAQNTPHLNLIDKKGIIRTQFTFAVMGC